MIFCLKVLSFKIVFPNSKKIIKKRNTRDGLSKNDFEVINQKSSMWSEIKTYLECNQTNLSFKIILNKCNIFIGNVFLKKSFNEKVCQTDPESS